MFFDDEQIGVKKKQTVLKQLPPTPDTGWLPPRYFPNLDDAIALAVDTETKDLELTEKGPGWGRNKGHIVGLSIAALDRYGNIGAWYFPVRHEVEPEYNLDPAQVFPWIKPYLENARIGKVFCNASYDIGWLSTEGIYVQGELDDVSFAEALIDEEGETNLEYIAHKYIGVGKDSSILYKWLADAYGDAVNSFQRKNIYRASPRLVGYYAESDARLPLQAIQHQKRILEAEGLLDVYKMECASIYMLVRMRLSGVRIDLTKAEQLYAELAIDVIKLQEQVYQISGLRINVDSGQDLAKLFDKLGLTYPKTDKGNPSFQKEYLKTVEHPVVKLVMDIREIQKIRSTFIKSYILESNINGRIFCQFHPLRGEGGGTITGRYSSSTPNLQNIPVRTKLGNRVRTLFIPDEGHTAWKKRDYSQIEYRMLAHFASGPGAEELRATYNNDPKADYHIVTQTNVKNITGIEIERKPIKNINFGLIYGQSEGSLAYKAGFTKEQARDIFKAYHLGAPYVKPTMAAIAEEVQKNGYIQTITGRRTRFNLWESMEYGKGDPLPYKDACRKYGSNIKRAFDYVGVNYKLQGSAADVIKRSMLACFQAGIFEVTGLPKLQVHDELDFSVKDYSPIQVEAYREMEYLLENSTPLKIPVKIESGDGPNWGAIE